MILYDPLVLCPKEQSYWSNAHDTTTSLAIVVDVFHIMQCRKASAPRGTAHIQFLNVTDPAGVKVIIIPYTILCFVPFLVCQLYEVWQTSHHTMCCPTCHSKHQSVCCEESHLSIIRHNSLRLAIEFKIDNTVFTVFVLDSGKRHKLDRITQRITYGSSNERTTYLFFFVLVHTTYFCQKYCFLLLFDIQTLFMFKY